MQQTAKKTLAVLLVLCMVLGFIPMGAQAALLDGDDYITQQLSLGEDLVLHLRASLPAGYEDMAATATGTVTYAGKTDTYTMGDLTPDENGMYDLPVEMAVAEMTENINVVLNGTYMGLPVEAINENYSIRNYLTTIIDGDYSQTTKDLCLELLNMGAWAQLYFNYNISDLANAGYSISAANAVPEESPTVRMEGAIDGLCFYGTSVRFLSQTAVRFYFTAEGAVDGYTFTIDGVEYEPVAKDGFYYIETPGINPQDMSKEITASVTDGTNTISVYYAPIWYFIRTYNKTEDEYCKGLMEAAYSYYKEAETYTTKICMDVEVSTLSGNYESIGLGFYPLDFEGDINNYVDRIEIPTGTAYTVKLDQGKYLVDGEFLGIGVTVLGGPAWDATLSDGSPDRHNITISDLRLEGPEDRPIDLHFATIASGNEGTGYTNANAGGTAAIADGVISIANGFFTDGYKITFNEIDTYLKLDMEITTLGNSTDPIDVGFYPYGFDGSYSDGYTDKLTLTAGTTNAVYLDASKYLVDGELPGIGFVVFGGPEWNTELEPGVYDRHTVKVSNVRFEGSVDQSFDMTNATVATGFAGSNSGGTAAVVDGIVSVTGGYRYDGHMITFVGETEPEVTEPEVTEPEVTEPESTEPPAEEPDTYISLDMLITTLGNSTDPIEVRFYPYNYEGSVHSSYTDLVTVNAGTATTVKLDLSKYLIDGQLTGIGFAIFGGPEWNTQLEDGTYDRHSVTISNVKLEGEQSTAYDLTQSVWASGQNGTGYTDANGSGTATIGSSIVITNGYRYDGHKITLVEDTNTYICMDMLLTTLGNSTDPVNVRFYASNYADSVHDGYTDLVSVTAGTSTTVKLKLDNYLVDGEFTGIGVGIFGGPAWDSVLEDGTSDKHAFTLSNIRLEGGEERTIDMRNATVTTGMTGSNSGGAATVADGTVSVTGGICYDAHMITFNEVDTYLKLDMLLTTLGNSNDPVEIGFFPHNFEGDINNATDKITVTAGTTTTVYLDSSKYMVDGELTGIGIAIFGGPEWNTTLVDGSYDRHSITISNVCLEGEVNQVIDLSNAAFANGQNGTGFTNANGSGTAAVVDGTIVITNGFRYDGHKITFVGETEPEVTEPVVTEPVVTEPDTTEPEVTEEPDTYISLDMLITTLGNSTDPIEVRFYPYNYEGSVHSSYTDLVTVNAGTATTVKLDLSKYLIDGQLTGIGFAIFGGPEWNTQLEDGTYDRHSVTISNVQLEGEQSTVYDLTQSVWAGGQNGTGYTDANGSGTATIGSSIVITNGYRYDGHKITLVEDTNTYICMDMLLTTLGNSTDPVNVRFYASNYADSVHNGYTDLVSVTAGTSTTIKLNLENYLVDGKFTGIGVGIFGGPAWDSVLEDGTSDKHAFTLSNIRLEGAEERTIDMYNATVTTGMTGSNSGGVATVADGTVSVTGGICYDAHMITFNEVDTYIVLDMLLTTLGNSSDPVEIGFFPYNFEGDINNATDKLKITAGEQTAVKLDLSKYLVDGQLTGIGFAIFGGPEWNTTLADGSYDRHSITISSVCLEGKEAKTFDLSQSVWASGQNGTGYTNANGSGTATIGSSIVITNGFRYDGHKISLVEDTNTYICMDLLLTTLGNSTDPIEVRFYSDNYTDTVHNGYTDVVTVTAGTATTVRLKIDDYLVDGAFNGIGVAIFGGPEWNTELEDGTYDRHNVVISNMRLEGVQEQTIDLSSATVSTGLTGSNAGGTITVVDGAVVISGGYRYDGYKITLG